MTKQETNISIIREKDKLTFKLDIHEGGNLKESNTYILGPKGYAIAAFLAELISSACKEQKQLNHDIQQ